MIPLPYELERNVGQPLKTAATVCSTFLLQTLGQPAIRDGNLILIDEVRLGVVDACSGLKMMVTFAAFSVGAVLLMQRTRFEKLMVLLGIVPIAIATNVTADHRDRAGLSSGSPTRQRSTSSTTCTAG